MAKRFVSIWCKYLLTDWLTISRPELKETVFVFTTNMRGRIMVGAANPLATRQGIFAGMALADAKAIVPDVTAFDDTPLLAEKILTRLGKWCIRFAPIVAMDAPNGLVLDCSGCTHLWGGEAAYLKTLTKRLKESGFDCRCAIADTIGTAWAIARYGTVTPIIKSNEQYNALLKLHPLALRIDDTINQRLIKLGFTTIEHFIQLPRSMLRRRFGEAFLLKLGQALGTEEETIKPLVIIAAYEVRLPCLEPVRTRTAIEIAINKLLEELCERLKKEGLGIREANLKGFRLDGKLTQIAIGTNQSTNQVNHLAKLFALKIQQIEPALGIELFVLTATKTEAVEVLQEKLWNGKPGLADTNLAQLLDRLAGKIGAHTIHRYLPQAHYWPERSLRPTVSLQEQSEVEWKLDNPRPMELLPYPERVQVTAPIPDYPPMNFRYKDELHLIKKADGPERIEREWWLERGEHRDYYVVEDEKGQRYWLFRSGHYASDNSAWFIHGFFA